MTNPPFVPFWRPPNHERIIECGMFRGAMVIVTDQSIYVARDADAPVSTALDWATIEQICINRARDYAKTTEPRE